MSQASRSVAGALLAGFVLLTGAQGQSQSYFPRLSFDPNTLTGIAIVNPTAEDAAVTLTAFDPNGTPLAGVENNVEVVVPAQQHFPGWLPNCSSPRCSVRRWGRPPSAGSGAAAAFQD